MNDEYGFVWFTSGNNVIGVGRMVDKYTGEVKYYINAVDGDDEERDKSRVMDWGARFPKEAGDALFPEFNRPVTAYEDRMGGQYTDEEIARSERGGWGW